MKFIIGIISFVLCVYFAKTFSKKFTYVKVFYSDYYTFNRTLINKVSYSNQSITAIINETKNNTTFYIVLDEYFNQGNKEIQCWFLSDDEKYRISQYLNEIGKTDRSILISYLNEKNTELKDLLNKATENEKKYKPLYVKLGVLIGLIIFVIAV